MEKIGIDLNHFNLYLDDLTKRQSYFLKQNSKLKEKLEDLDKNLKENKKEEIKNKESDISLSQKSDSSRR